MDNITKQVLDVLENNERLIHQLYTRFSERLPDHRMFWLNIAAEEAVHAEWIHSLQEKASQQKLSFKSARLKLSSIQLVESYIRQKIEEVADRDLTHSQAFNIAMDIEKTLVEDRLFELFETEDDDVKKIFEKLKAASAKHAALLYRA